MEIILRSTIYTYLLLTAACFIICVIDYFGMVHKINVALQEKFSGLPKYKPSLTEVVVNLFEIVLTSIIPLLHTITIYVVLLDPVKVSVKTKASNFAQDELKKLDDHKDEEE